MVIESYLIDSINLILAQTLLFTITHPLHDNKGKPSSLPSEREDVDDSVSFSLIPMVMLGQYLLNKLP